jgi:hypothetical protein
MGRTAASCVRERLRFQPLPARGERSSERSERG